MMLHSHLQMPNLNTSSKAIGHGPLPRPELFASLVMAVALFLTTFNVVGANAQQPPQQQLFYIPHTHWEGAVFKTREEYLEMGIPNILKAVQLLKQYPEYKFTLDQVAYFRPFLERYPEEAMAFRKFVAEGRLEIVGGMDVMPDDVKPGGELFVRQIQYGKRYCREELGVDVKVAWFLDTFGHHPQLPQLLRQAGYDSFWFCRGVPNRNLPSEFQWRGIDGTEIPAFWLPGFYGLLYGPPRQMPQFSQFFRQRFNSLTPHVGGPERVGLAGVDVSEPEEYVPPLIAAFNAQSNVPFAIRYSVPGEFAAVVARRPNPTIITNDFNPIFQGTYSSRIELKQATRQIEQLLLTAEKLAALAKLYGAGLEQSKSSLNTAMDQIFWRAWEPVLFNQTHDLASGVMTDHVYEDTVGSYDFSRRLAGEMIENSWGSIADHIDTRGEGVPVLVFNPLGWLRTDVAEVEVGFAETGVHGVSIFDSSGHSVPAQFLMDEHYNDGGLKRVRLVFIAHEVPALGYSTYRVVPGRSGTGRFAEAAEIKDGGSIENEFYRAAFSLATGEITSLLEKSDNWEALSGPGNVVACQQDKGDLWELYRGLDGGSHVAMTNQQPVPTEANAILSSRDKGTNGIVRNGPVFSEFSVEHSLGSGSFATHVRLYDGVPRVDIKTELVNREKYVRYQVLFPTTIRNGHNVQEIPFGALERPAGIEFPAQHWVDYCDDNHGVALLNAGMPGNLVTEGVLMLSLMRAHNLGAYGFGGGYEPGMSSETGFELDRKRTFHYALVPHSGDWRGARVYRAGLEFNHPLLVHKAVVHAGDLPDHWGLIEISAPNVVLTALKSGPEQSTVFRVYEATGQTTQGARIQFHARVSSAYEANLLEDSGHKLPVRHDSIVLDMHPFEIKTIKLQLRAKR
jgi:alpha-mannosidase